jgi:hypothetical protein
MHARTFGGPMHDECRQSILPRWPERGVAECHPSPQFLLLAPELHPFHNLNSEQVQSALDRAGGEVAQTQPAQAQLLSQRLKRCAVDARRRRVEFASS